MLISMKGFVLIAMSIKALECVMILCWVVVKMKSLVHRATYYFPKRTNNTVPTERLA